MNIPKFSKLQVLWKRFEGQETTSRENYLLLGTDNVCGKICEHIFAPHGGYCLCIYQCQAPGGWVGHRVRILTFSIKKIVKNPTPRHTYLPVCIHAYTFNYLPSKFIAKSSYTANFFKKKSCRKKKKRSRMKYNKICCITIPLLFLD